VGERDRLSPSGEPGQIQACGLKAQIAPTPERVVANEAVTCDTTDLIAGPPRTAVAVPPLQAREILAG
jgi:hypothetical protein